MKSNTRLILCFVLLASCFSSVSGQAVIVTSADGYMNLRSGPNAKNQVVGRIYSGEVSAYIESFGNWHLVRSPKGLTGYVYTEGVKITEDHPRLAGTPQIKHTPLLVFSRHQVLDAGNDPDCQKQFSKDSGLNYSKTVSDATNFDPKALEKLIAFGRFDGAAFEMHSDTLWKLMHFWGDARFNQFLEKTSAGKLRKKAAPYLKNADIEDTAAYMKTYFPRTWRGISNFTD